MEENPTGTHEPIVTMANPLDIDVSEIWDLGRDPETDTEMISDIVKYAVQVLEEDGFDGNFLSCSPQNRPLIGLLCDIAGNPNVSAATLVELASLRSEEVSFEVVRNPNAKNSALLVVLKQGSRKLQTLAKKHPEYEDMMTPF